MKLTKHVLAVVLSLALALGLDLPAFAAVDWNKFQFTKRPKDITIKHGDSFTLSVDVAVPEGVEVEYQWYCGNNKIENATTHELHLSSGDSFYPPNERLGGTSTPYDCVITAYEKDDAENIVSSRKLTSNTANVTTKRTALGKFYDITVEPFVYAFGGTVGLLSMTMLGLLPVAPLAFLGFLVYGFIKGIGGLFA